MLQLRLRASHIQEAGTADDDEEDNEDVEGYNLTEVLGGAGVGLERGGGVSGGGRGGLELR